jgi:mRNA interferase RelE/StbE
MLPIEISRAARKSLTKLPAKHARQIADRLLSLRKDPEPHDSAPLKESRLPYRRVDTGEYRVIYRVENGVVRVALVGARNDDAVDKAFRRLRDP